MPGAPLSLPERGGTSVALIEDCLMSWVVILLRITELSPDSIIETPHPWAVRLAS